MADLVEFERTGVGNRVGIARLVRGKSLNSLLLDTIDELSRRICPWLEDDTLACLVLDSSSDRAFCAGADIMALYQSIREAKGGPNPYAEDFFLKEYRLDYALHTTHKPILAWGNGIVMGGGLGLLGGCSHRVGTPQTRIAMPEISIGLFPDAGGTWFLSRLSHLGIFAGLTGCQLSAGDGLRLGLLDYVVEQDAKQEIFSLLLKLDWDTSQAANKARLDKLLEARSVPGPLPENLLRHKEVIDDLVQRSLNSNEFLAEFEKGLDTLPDDDWLNRAVATYRGGSPTTARIFMEQMKRAAGMSLADMFRMELVIARQCVRHGDFPEGVRALLVDKDGNPRWTYPTVAEVPEEYIAAHFEPTWRGEHPLAMLGS